MLTYLKFQMILNMRVFALIPIILYGIVGIISLIMAYKNLSSKRFIAFHAKAATIPWDSINKPLQSVILALMKVSGLGFLVTALLLLVFPIVNYFRQDGFIKYSIPTVSIIFCFGLFLINYYLHKQTNSETPWRGALIASVGILLGIVLSFFI
jgi:hypothetical protein